MRFSSLTFGLLLSGVNAHPHRGSSGTTASLPTNFLPATPSATLDHAIRQRSIEAADAGPNDLIYEETSNDYVFEIGSELVDKLNKIGNESCTTSEDDCQTAVGKVFNALPETGNYFVRSSNETDNEPRQLSAIAGAAEVAVVAYMLHKLSSGDQHELIHVNLDDEADVDGPVEITLPKANFPESVTGTETTSTTNVPFEKFVLIATPLATNEKGVSALSSAIAAIATDGPVVPSISDYNLGLPGWFHVNATHDQQLELALIPGVEYVVDGLGPLMQPASGPLDDDDNDNGDDADSGDTDPVRRSESSNATHGSIHAKRGADSRDLPQADPGERDPSDCLRFASWGDGMQSAPEYYLYQEKQGQDYPIYSVESGWDLSHAEFGDAQTDYIDYDPVEDGQPVPGERMWFNGGSANLDSRTSITDSDVRTTEHGTVVLSQLMGKTIGVLPQVRPILVRISQTGVDYEAAFRNIASHIEQRQLNQQEKRSPIVALSVDMRMYGNAQTADRWPHDRCVWAYRLAGHFQKLVDLGATVLIAAGQFYSDETEVPGLLLVIAQHELGQPCWEQHGIDIPTVEGLHVVTSVDTFTRRSLRNRQFHPFEVQGAGLAGPWNCGSVTYDSQSSEYTLNRYVGTSGTNYWAAGILGDLAYQAEDKDELPTPDTPLERAKALIESAKDLMWTQEAPSEQLKQAAFWNGLRQFGNRNDSSTTAITTASSPTSSTLSTTSDPAPTSSSAPASTSSSPPSPPPQSWASGWCGIHLKQKVYNSEASQLKVTILDADQSEIGGDDGDGPNLDYGQSHAVSSELPMMMVVTATGPDKPVSFAYGSQTWSSDDKDAEGNARCGVGKWDGGVLGSTATRQMDCGFSC